LKKEKAFKLQTNIAQFLLGAAKYNSQKNMTVFTQKTYLPRLQPVRWNARRESWLKVGQSGWEEQTLCDALA